MKMLRAILALLVLICVASWVFAEPTGPININVESSTAGQVSNSAVQVDALGGNVTQLTINASTITGFWQGYYGDITGNIQLADGSGNVLYDWNPGSSFSPTGNIYAANQTIIDWTDVICLSISGPNTAASGINASVLETMYGMDSGDGDGIIETFNSTQDITVGTNPLTNCYGTHMYVNNASQSVSWNESLLTENQTKAVIYATEIEQDANGFNNQTWDFQMMVGDNADDSVPTTYYFYVELS